MADEIVDTREVNDRKGVFRKGSYLHGDEIEVIVSYSEFLCPIGIDVFMTRLFNELALEGVVAFSLLQGPTSRLAVA